MNFKDDALDERLNSINQKFIEDIKKLTQKTFEQLEDTKYELTNICSLNMQEKKIFFKKFFEKKYNMIPKIQIVPENNNNDLNYFINVVLFIFANLENVAQFCLEEKYKEILKKLDNNNNNNFIVLFIDLIKNMYITKNNNINIEPIHNFLKSELNKDFISYLCQNPSILINKLLEYLYKDIKKTNERNIIKNNFLSTLKTMKFCTKCKLLIEIQTEKKFVMNLYLKETINKQIHEEMKSILKPLLLDEQLETKKFPCLTCKQDMTVYRTIENPKNYLIFNIEKSEKLKNPIKMKYSTNLKLTEVKNEKEYEFEYELIMALTDKKTNVLNPKDNNNIINEQYNCALYFKNFIKDDWHRLINGKYEHFKGNIKNELNEKKPNILIYKKKFRK